MKNNIFLKTRESLFATLFLMFCTMLPAQNVESSITFEYSSTSQSFTVPIGVNSIAIEAWGGGGAGGGGYGASSRGGGGGGAYTKFSIAVTPGQVYTIDVGQGGSGESNPGGTGGASKVYFGNTVIVSANGGFGGTGVDGGAGGKIETSVPTTGTGLIRHAGGKGANADGGNGGGGGGSAGTAGNGGTSTSRIGGAAGSGTGGKPGASGGNGGERFLFYSDSGDNGNIPGAGGGGRSSSIINNNLSGGDGANGRIILSFIISPSDLAITKTPSNVNTAPGEVESFTIVAKNKRSTPVYDVVVTDILPSGYTFISANQQVYDKISGRWEIGTLTANATKTLTITALVNSSGEYNNTATIISETMPDGDTSDNTATAVVNVCKAGTISPQVKNPE